MGPGLGKALRANENFPFAASRKLRIKGVPLPALCISCLGGQGWDRKIQYFADVYPVRVEAVGYKSLYVPENSKPRS